MDRRKGMAIAGTVALTVASGVLALGANLGLFGLADRSDPVGQLRPVDAVVRHENGLPTSEQPQDRTSQQGRRETGEHADDADDSPAHERSERDEGQENHDQDQEHRQGWEDDD